MTGADDYVIAGSGIWVGDCNAFLFFPYCTVTFAAPPPAPICDFTVSAVRDNVVGLPSLPFCIS